MAGKSSQFLRFTDRPHGGRILVEGECTSSDHDKEIDCNGWDWAVDDPSTKSKKDHKKQLSTKGASAAKGSAGGVGVADHMAALSRFRFSKKTDKSTTQLLGAMNRGEIYPVAVMTMEEEFEASPTRFKLQVILTEVTVVNFDWDVSAADARADMDEKWELNYRTINIRYDWQGKPTIQSTFTMTAGADEGASEKSPPTTEEQRSKRDKEMEDWAKRSGWKPPGKR